ncbi:hypothetical protein QBC38DRAFT_148004 [Podospora fimiseda]|uniref:Uncharacterized protein n=1 Tax=Podospora fimiseda TaxID=252190 RepID=A0AAN7H1H1_9PEZI|nr:hypothetical protein QBC38DRAFT_148004 [Podospora fimiseda]
MLLLPFILPLLPISLASRPLPPSITACAATRAAIHVSDTISAAQSLASYCGELGPVTEYTKLSWVTGNSRVYICNYNFWQWDSCRYDEIFSAWVTIQKQCGLTAAGWIYYPEDDKTRVGGKTIGFDDKDADWCDNLQP